LWLVKNGIPFDVAFRLDDVTRAGWSIMFAEMEGATFDFETMTLKRDNNA
jgi:hypothetical protein